MVIPLIGENSTSIGNITTTALPHLSIVNTTRGARTCTDYGYGNAAGDELLTLTVAVLLTTQDEGSGYSM